MRYGVASDLQVRPRYNIAPGQSSAVVLQKDDDITLSNMKWGIPLGERNVINVRKESLQQKKQFQSLMENHRCLVPATGFYEWRASKVGKIPFFFYLPELRTFSLAGVWMQDRMGGLEFAIITLPSQPPVSRVHHRMPLLLDESQEDDWLRGSVSKATMLLDGRSQSRLRMHQVAPTVNDPVNEYPGIVEPVMRIEDWSR